MYIIISFNRVTSSDHKFCKVVALFVFTKGAFVFCDNNALRKPRGVVTQNIIKTTQRQMFIHTLYKALITGKRSYKGKAGSIES